MVPMHTYYITQIYTFNNACCLRTDHLTCRGGGERGSMGFLFVQKLFSVNTRVRILIFCRAKRAFFFLEFNIMLYDKNSE
jgi:hypothetical protein